MKTFLRDVRCYTAASMTAAFVVCLFLFQSGSVVAQCQITFPGQPENQTINCGQDFPVAPPCQAVSSCCDGPVEVSSFTSQTGSVNEDCTLSTAFGPGTDWAFWLPDFQGISVAWNFVGIAHLQTYADGTAHLWGTIANASNPALTFDVEMWFANARNWSEWSALGRSYKDDFGIAGSQHLNWTYFELADGFATLTGTGTLEGSYLHLHHKPADYFYGFQLGLAANNKNLNEGFSGWFTYDGMYNGQSVSGHGDVNVDKACNTISDDCGSTAITHICRADDACGNFAFSQYTISAVDNTPPVAEPFEDIINVDCLNYEGVFIAATDDCSTHTITYTDEIIQEGCGGQLIRHYTMTDGCGNQSFASQTINLLGEQEPEFTVFPDDITIECDAIDDLQMPDVEWINGCGNTSLNITSVELPGQCAGSYQIIYTYTLTDACDNLVAQNWTITVEDNTAPQLFNIPDDITIQCGDVIVGNDVFALDNCDENPNVTLEAITIQLTCGYEFVRTWTATDACGNTTSASQTISVIDNVSPVFSFVPPALNINCGEAFEIEEAIAEDACSPFELSWEDEFTGDCAGSYIRTWTAIDGCGNETTETTAINITDTQNPIIINAPQDITVDCDEVPTVESAMLEFSDNCGSVDIAFFEDIFDSEECAGNYTINRLWILTDDCGNRTDHVWVINVIDSTEPILFGVPQNETLSCGEEPTEAVVFATDNCDAEVDIELSAITSPNECGYDFIRTWTASDDCGNTSTATQIISFTDNEAPVFTFVPEDVNLACSSDFNLDDLELATATDDCSDVQVTYTDTPLGGNCGDGLLRTFSAIDACGNVINAEQFINFSDEIAPVFTFVPENIVAECGTTVTLEDALATDNCSGVTITFADEPAGGCAGSFIRTFTATDGCGNAATAQTSVLFTDNEAPVVINAPADVTVNCDEVPTVESAMLEYSDNCGSVSMEFFEDIFEGVGQCPGSYQITRLWVLTDECGNRTDVLWTINVSDISAPTLVGVPSNQSLNCGEEPAEAIVFAIDNCDADVNVVLSATTEPADCGYNFIRTWTATDDCGNSVSASQVIEYTDNVDPFFTYVPQSASLICSDNGGIPDNEIAIADDECSDVMVTFEDVPSEQGCVGGITRIWTATDACGNTATASTTYTIEDNQAPQFIIFPEDITVLNCIDIPTVESAGVTYIDNCSSVSVSFSENIIELDCANSNIIERTWTLTDACGNTNSATWTIYALDEQAPQIFGVPADITIACGQAIEDVQIFATDNCTASENLIISLEAETFQNPCGNVFRRTWTVTDECGNSVEAVQEITVVDELAPVFADYQESVTVTCGSEFIIETPIAIDACSEVTYSVIEEPLPGCIEGIVRTTIATDGCGNSSSAIQTITVTDTQAPMPSMIPSDINATCDNIPVIAQDAITFTDACSDVNVTFSSDMFEGSCSNEYEIVYQWLAEDACGNRTDIQQSIFVSPPALGMTDLPDDLIISCSDPVPAPQFPTVTGACNLDIPVNLETTSIPGTCPGTELILRRFYIEDDCDRTYTHIQLIQVIDNQPPVFEPFAPQISLPCSQSSGVFVVATDACSSVQVTYTDQQIGAGCGGTIQRTYTATDLCGNSSTAIQFIQLIDTEAPVVISFPSDISVSCSEIPSIANANIVATDNCSNVFIEATEEIISGDCANSYTILRTFLIEDNCGNAEIRTWTIQVADTESPSIIGVPDDITIDCNEDIPSVNPIAVDNCTTFPSLSLEATTIELECGFQFVRTWTATDECGNTTSVTQTVTVSDLNAPELSAYPEDLILACGENVPEAPVITAFDSCQGDLDVIFEETASGSEPCSEIVRTWCVTDCAGNQTCHTQTIIFNDAIQQVNAAQRSETSLAVYRSSRDMLNINSNVGKSGNWKLDVFDITGRLVMPVYSGYMETGIIIPFTVDPSQFSDELYFIRLTNGETTIIRKIAFVD